MRYHGKELRKGRVSIAGQVYVIAAVTHQRKLIFSDWSSAAHASRLLHSFSNDAHVQTLAWVVMPDHIHWMFALKDGPLHRPVQHLKSVIARDVNIVSGTTGQLWQKGYHERAVRSEEDLRAVARYIVMNPVRAGLVRRAGEYSFWNAAWL